MCVGKRPCFFFLRKIKGHTCDTRGESNSIPCRMCCVCLLRAKFLFFSSSSTFAVRFLYLFMFFSILSTVVYLFVGTGSLTLAHKQQQSSQRAITHKYSRPHIACQLIIPDSTLPRPFLIARVYQFKNKFFSSEIGSLKLQSNAILLKLDI